MSKKKEPQQYMTIADTSKEWKMPSAKVKQLCEEKKIAGISKLGDDWIIPVDAEKPLPESKLSKPVVPKNKIQEAALEHIEAGDPFDVHEHTIDGKTFIVSSVFQRQGPTLEEIMLSLMIGDLERETGQYLPAGSIEKARKKIRKDSNAAKSYI